MTSLREQRSPCNLHAKCPHTLQCVINSKASTFFMKLDEKWSTWAGDKECIILCLMCLPNNEGTLLLRRKMVQVFCKYLECDQSLSRDMLVRSIERSGDDDDAQDDEMEEVDEGDEVPDIERLAAQDDDEVTKQLLEHAATFKSRKPRHKRTSYDSENLCPANHKHKDDMIKKLVVATKKHHNVQSLSELDGIIVELDDFGPRDAEDKRVPRVASGLLKAQAKPGRIWAPNRDQAEVVEALCRMSVPSKQCDIIPTIESLPENIPINVGYMDGLSPTPEYLMQKLLKGTIEHDEATNRTLVLAYTMTEGRDFTGRDFVSRVLRMTHFMEQHGFKPCFDTAADSYFAAPKRALGDRAGTAFWVRNSKANLRSAAASSCAH